MGGLVYIFRKADWAGIGKAQNKGLCSDLRLEIGRFHYIPEGLFVEIT
jgi:hypothetical protein